MFEAFEGVEKATLFGEWRPTPEFSKGKPIPAEDWKKILAVFPKPRFNRTLHFMAATGCRLDQATSLDWSQYRDFPIPGFDLKKQKKAQRFVPVTPAVREIVGERKGVRLPFGGPDLYRSLGAAWRYRVQKKLKMSYRLHDIRHTVGTALRESAGVENGASALGVTAAMMGIYGEHNRDLRNALVLEAMQNSLGNRRATIAEASVSQSKVK